MGIEWNPNFPRQLGVEHLGTGFRHRTVQAAWYVPMRFRARRSGQVDTVDLYAGPGAQATALDSRYEGLNRPMIFDLFPGGSASYSLGVDTFTPTAVTGIGTIVNENLTTPPNVNRITVANDGLFLAAPQLGDGVAVQFNTQSFPLNRRIFRVALGVKVNLTTGIRRVDNLALPAGSNPWFINLPWWTNGTQVIEMAWGEAKVDAGTGQWSHWTAQQIRDFRSASLGGTRAVRVTAQAGPGFWNLDQVYMKVWWATENRIGIGIGMPVSGPAWIPFDLRTPTATTSPSLVAGNEYVGILRRIVDYSYHGVAQSVMPWRTLNGPSPDGSWCTGDAGLGQPGVGSQIPGDCVHGIPCARFTDNGQVVTDAQPYNLARGALVWSGQDLTQSITVAGAATSVLYGQAFVVAGFDFDRPRPEAPLLCEVVRVSDGVTVFSPVPVTADEVAMLPAITTFPGMQDTAARDDQNISYRLVRYRFPETQTLPAGQYRIRLYSPGTSKGRAWRVGALMADAHNVDQTFGGTVDAAEGVFITASGDTQLTDVAYSSDAQVTLVDVPAAVTGVGVALGEFTGHHAEVCDGPGCPHSSGCSDMSIPTAVITWSPAPSGDPDVVAYEIQRQDDTMAPDDWEDVAVVQGRSTTEWEDHEGRIGVPTRYRVRVVRADEVTGDWSTEVAITIPVGQVALSLSSNAATGMGLVYPEVWPGQEVEREWSFLEAGDVTFSRFYGRNRQVAFRPLEDPGTELPSRTLLLNAQCSVSPPTTQIFRPLRDLARAPIPYVCVRDGEGNRWYATVIVPTGVNLRPGERWLVEARFVEVADRAHPQDTATPQITEPASV